ncbi:MAG: hypothetical protein GY805_21480 [Chloroflexi bacterium]|nr:hypothetical protein [Chloroflexota bacterium]
MKNDEVIALREAIEARWGDASGYKMRRYVDKFWDRTRRGRTITALVEGNHGDYTVSIDARESTLMSACSCYKGKGGYCHHCAALGQTFLAKPDSFVAIVPTPLEDVHDLESLKAYLNSVALVDLVKQLRANGITQKAFAESIGMSSRHLSAVKSSELHNRYYHELGATKLACLWVLDKFGRNGKV